MTVKLTDDFLKRVAQAYEEHADTGKPAVEIAAEFNTAVATARRWVTNARQRGFLPPTTPGLPSGYEPKKPLGEAGNNVRANVAALRKGRRYTYVELSARLDDTGRPIAVLGLQRLEAGTRRVDADDLVALAAVFGVEPAHLLGPVPPCETCHGAPPVGLACTVCGTGTRED